MKIINFPYKGITKKPGAELGFAFFLKSILVDHNKYFSDTEFIDMSQYTQKNLIKFDNENILFFGGDHSTTSKIINDVLSNAPRNIIIFDAHNDYENIFQETYKNWNVINFLEKLKFSGLLLGYRFDDLNMKKVSFLKYIRDTEFQELRYVLDELKLFCIKSEVVYVSIDLDVLNFVEFPGTGFRCAGGISLRELLICLNTIIENSKRLIVDIVEFNPLIEHEYSLEILKRLFYELKILMSSQERRNGNLCE